jgi:hypothetical protein
MKIPPRVTREDAHFSRLETPEVFLQMLDFRKRSFVNVKPETGFARFLSAAEYLEEKPANRAAPGNRRISRSLGFPDQRTRRIAPGTPALQSPFALDKRRIWPLS